MKKIDLEKSIGVLANLGVLLGLLVLILELNQNNDLLIAQTRVFLNDTRLIDQQAVVENRGGIAAILRKASSGETLTDVERTQLGRRRAMLIRNWAENFKLVTDGPLSLDDLPIGLWRVEIETESGMSRGFENMKSELDPEFVKFMEENVIDR